MFPQNRGCSLSTKTCTEGYHTFQFISQLDLLSLEIRFSLLHVHIRCGLNFQINFSDYAMSQGMNLLFSPLLKSSSSDSKNGSQSLVKSSNENTGSTSVSVEKSFCCCSGFRGVFLVLREAG